MIVTAIERQERQGRERGNDKEERAWAAIEPRMQDSALIHEMKMKVQVMMFKPA